MTNIHVVTEDPAVVAVLRERLDNGDGLAAARYARDLGLRPPVDPGNVAVGIHEYWPPGTDSEDGLLVWDTHMTTPSSAHADNEEPEDDEDDDDPWGGLVPTEDTDTR